MRTLGPDASSLIETLDADAIAAELAELDRQQRALRVLLRAARARQRVTHKGRVSGKESKAIAH
jgi:hypothetical protein